MLFVYMVGSITMKNPLWMLRSRLGWLNFFLLQWLFVRLQEVGGLDEKQRWVHRRWELLWAPLPLTGWWSKYIYLHKGKAARREKAPPLVPRYTYLKRSILSLLETSPRGATAIERHLRELGFRTPRIMFKALQELVDAGEVRVKPRDSNRTWLYERVKSKLSV